MNVVDYSENQMSSYNSSDDCEAPRPFVKKTKKKSKGHQNSTSNDGPLRSNAEKTRLPGVVQFPPSFECNFLPYSNTMVILTTKCVFVFVYGLSNEY